MKRKNFFLICLSVCLLIFVTTTPALSYAVPQEQTVKEFLYNYFNNRYLLMTQNPKAVGIDVFASPNANSEWRELEHLRQVAFDRIAENLGIEYDGFSFELDIREMETHEGTIDITLIEHGELRRVDGEIPIFKQANVEHLITLEPGSTKLGILNDQYEDVMTFQIRGRSEVSILESIDEKLVSQAKTEPTFITSLPPSDAYITATYNRTAAVNYANNWVNGRNTSEFLIFPELIVQTLHHKQYTKVPTRPCPLRTTTTTSGIMTRTHVQVHIHG
ncbi:MAG: hypothetical protein WA116_02875 [Anaerolineaceae bacterium]